jgi:hypothetical protein
MNCLTNTIYINSVMSILFVCYLYDRVTEDMGKPSGGDGVLTPMKSLMNITGNIVFGPIRYFQWILPSIFADLSFYLLYSQSPITLYLYYPAFFCSEEPVPSYTTVFNIKTMETA